MSLTIHQVERAFAKLAERPSVRPPAQREVAQAMGVPLEALRSCVRRSGRTWEEIVNAHGLSVGGGRPTVSDDELVQGVLDFVRYHRHLPSAGTWDAWDRRPCSWRTAMRVAGSMPELVNMAGLAAPAPSSRVRSTGVHRG